MSEKIEVMRTLAEWFKKYGWVVFFNQKNPDGYPTFHGNTNSKPDILAMKNHANILIEVKNGKTHQDILDGFDQTIRYAGEYYTGRSQYFNPQLFNKTLNVNAFLLATKYSKNGYLYANESNLNYLEYSFLSETYNMIEKPITHSIIRIFWRQWEKGLASDHYETLRRGRAAQHIRPPNKPRIGAIVAKTFASSRQVTSIPYLYLNSNQFIPMNHWQIPLLIR